MAINLKGVWLGCKYGIPALRRAGGGSIINTASFVALVGAATPQIAYTASKGGVLAMTRELAVIHARENIRVNALCPVRCVRNCSMKFLRHRGKAAAATGAYSHGALWRGRGNGQCRPLSGLGRSVICHRDGVCSGWRSDRRLCDAGVSGYSILSRLAEVMTGAEQLDVLSLL